MKLGILIFLSIGLIGCQTLLGHYQKNKGHIKSVCEDIMDGDTSKEDKTYKLCLAEMESAQVSLDTTEWVKAGVMTYWSFIGFNLLIALLTHMGSP